MKTTYTNVKKRLAVTSLLCFLIITLLIVTAIYSPPETMTVRLPAFTFLLWVFCVILGSFSYRLHQAEPNSLEINYPMSAKEAYIFFGGIKFSFITVSLSLLPIPIFILYAVFT